MKIKAFFRSLVVLGALFFFLGESSRAELPSLSATEPSALREHVGQEVVVEGRVRTIGRTPDGRITFLNFGTKDSDSLVGVVFERAYGEFPDGFDNLKGQMVRLTGWLTLHEEVTPQIRLESAAQVQLMEAGTQEAASGGQMAD